MTKTPGDISLSACAEHTAIPSWSGFVYQGKIAVYHTLILLCHNKECNYSIQLDYFEDFSILNNIGEIVSLHQVKALATRKWSSYKNHFDKLESKALKYVCQQAYFHLANEIEDKTVAEIASMYEHVKIYQYQNSLRICEVGSIDSMVETVIRRYYEEHHPIENWRIDSKYLDLVRTHLYEMIQMKVSEIHAFSQVSGQGVAHAASKAKIELSQIKQLLESNLNETAGEDYYLYKSRQDLRRYFDEFNESMNNDPVITKKISDYMVAIEALDKNSFVKFIQNIRPHRNIAFNSLQDYKDNALIQDEIKCAFFTILKELKETEFNARIFHIFWDVNGSRKFYLTTINHGATQAQRICVDIVKNALSKDIGLMYDKDSLITTDIDVVSIADKAGNIFETQSSDASHIMNWKKVSLISLSSAKGEIHD